MAEFTLNFTPGPRKSDDQLRAIWQDEVRKERATNSGAIVVVGVLTRTNEIIRENDDPRFRWRLGIRPYKSDENSVELNFESSNFLKVKVEIRQIVKNKKKDYVFDRKTGINCERYLKQSDRNPLRITFGSLRGNFVMALFIKITVLGEWVGSIFDGSEDEPVPADHYEIVTPNGTLYYRKENDRFLPEFLRLMLRANNKINIQGFSLDAVRQALQACEGADFGEVNPIHASRLLFFFRRYTPPKSIACVARINDFESELQHFQERMCRKFAKIRYGPIPEVNERKFERMAPVTINTVVERMSFSSEGQGPIVFHKDINFHYCFYTSRFNRRNYLSFGMYLYHSSGQPLPDNIRVPIEIEFLFDEKIPMKIARVLTSAAPTIGCPTLLEFDNCQMLHINDTRFTVSFTVSRCEWDHLGLVQSHGEPNMTFAGVNQYQSDINRMFVTHHCVAHNLAFPISTYFYPSNTGNAHKERITRLFFDILYHGTADVKVDDMEKLLTLAHETSCVWVKNYVIQALYNTEPEYPRMPDLNSDVNEIYVDVRDIATIGFPQMAEFLKVGELQDEETTTFDEYLDDVQISYNDNNYSKIA